MSEKYGPQRGLALLARDERGSVIGCGAYRRIAPGICEMKRVFVPDLHKGKGIGRALCQNLIAAAQKEGYALMRLDTANLLTEAIALYRSLGFRACAPYNEYPPELMPYLAFMELPLDGVEEQAPPRPRA